MPTAHVNGVDLCYENYGSDEAPPLLLVMGLGAQLTLWQTGFVAELLERGFRVIRFDNRDVGLSSKTPGDPPDIGALMAEFYAGQPVSAPYTLATFADDAMALLDHLDIEAAHVVGASMGGMIAQRMAIEHPGRLLSLTSIMSSTGNPEVGTATPEAMGALMTPPPPDRDGAIATGVAASKAIAGPLWDEQDSLERAREAYDRCFHPTGSAFQFAAILADGDRTEALGELDLPTLVIHGREDPLVQLSGGLATAEAIPGADLLVLGQMGHDLPPTYWPQIADAIIGIARASDPGHTH